jgi:hypothetical protein
MESKSFFMFFNHPRHYYNLSSFRFRLVVLTCNLHFYGTINKERSTRSFVAHLFSKASSLLTKIRAMETEGGKIYEIEFLINFYGSLNVVERGNEKRRAR